MEPSRTPIRSMKFRIPSTDRILSLTAIFVSICTLFILFYQTRLSQKMYYLEEKAQKMSVFPHLDLGQSQTPGMYYKLLLINSGVGPAKIRDVKILYNDSVYHMDPAHFISEIDSTLSFYNSSIHKGRLVAANESIEVIGNENHGSEDLKKLAQIFSARNFNIAVDYTSIYEDQVWTVYFKPGAFPESK